jgi:hypothetical protein
MIYLSKILPYLSWKYATIALSLIVLLFTGYGCWKSNVESKQVLKSNIESLKKAEEVRLEKKEEIQKLEKKQQRVIKNDEELIRNRRYFDTYSN